MIFIKKNLTNIKRYNFKDLYFCLEDKNIALKNFQFIPTSNKHLLKRKSDCLVGMGVKY